MAVVDNRARPCDALFSSPPVFSPHHQARLLARAPLAHTHTRTLSPSVSIPNRHHHQQHLLARAPPALGRPAHLHQEHLHPLRLGPGRPHVLIRVDLRPRRHRTLSAVL